MARVEGDPVWDIADRQPVELPDEGEGTLKGVDVLSASQFRRDIEIDRYEKAVMAMPKQSRDRYLRSMHTADVIMDIARNAGRF